MNKLSLLLICLLYSVASYSQKVDEAAYAEALRMKSLFKDKEVATLRSSTHYAFYIDKATHSLKVKETGEEQYIALRANVKQTIRSYYSEKLLLEPYTIKNEKGRSILHDKYCGHIQQGDIFYSDTQVCAYNFSLTQVGQTAKYEGNKIYNDAKYLTYEFFHSDVPSKERIISVYVPDQVKVELQELNFGDYPIEKITKPEKGGQTITYSFKNIDAFPEDSHLPGPLHYLPHLLILTKSFSADGKVTNVLSSTDDLYKWYSSLTSQLNQNYDELKPQVAKLTAGLLKDEDKIKAIYYWVQDNIQYIAFEDGLAGFKPEEAKEVFYKRYGDCKGMAHLTKAMLQVAGYDARLTWIGTNKIPYSYSQPTLAVDNHMICTVLLGDRKIILDATEKYGAIGTYAERIQGKEIMIEDGAKYKLSRVPEELQVSYLQESNFNYEIKEHALVGNGREIIRGEFNKVLLNMVNDSKKEEVIKLIKAVVAGPSNVSNFTIGKYSDFDRDQSLSIAYDIKLKDHVYVNNNEMYIDLDFKDDYKDLKFEKERKTPYKFSSRVFRKTRAELILPKGFKLTHAPETISIKNDYFTFDLGYSEKDNKVIYTKEIQILKSTLPIGEFQNWNKAIEEVNKFYQDQLTIKGF
jgi:transglutaminase-like putative cysteine protease